MISKHSISEANMAFHKLRSVARQSFSEEHYFLNERNMINIKACRDDDK